MSIFEAIVLGLVQGLTEFLPISSSAHLVLVPWFLGWKDPGLAFSVILHLGTLVAVVGYFLGDWLRLLRAGIASILDRKIGYERDRQMFWMFFFGSLPVGIAGLVFHDLSAGALRSPLLIAISLAAVGFLMYWVDARCPPYRNLQDMTMKDALWIGFAQMFALIPGVSRSGSTMTMGRFLGVNRESAARFSFLLSVPIIFAAGVVEVKGYYEAGGFAVENVGALAAGFFASLVAGWVSIHGLLGYLRNADFSLFAWYRILIAVGIVAFSLVTGH